MKDKIRTFLNHTGLTAAQLADRIGVQRSSFSHILNGRNKPSADFVIKLLESYPDINANWLFGNQENMLITQRNKVKTPDLFSPLENINTIQSVSNQENRSKPEAKFTSGEYDAGQVVDSTSRKIMKIVIFYSDHSFDEFNPG